MKSLGLGSSSLSPFLCLMPITISFSMFPGIGSNPTNSVLHMALPSVAERISPENPNNCATGAFDSIMVMSPSDCISSIEPRRPCISRIAPPIWSCGTWMNTFWKGSRRVAPAISIAACIACLDAGMTCAGPL